MEEFLNPKANLTPGALGSFMMILANGICCYFPELEFRWVALILSMLIAVSTVSVIAMTIPKKFAFWFLNALVIFVVGVGSSNIGANIADKGTEYSFLSTSNAYADTYYNLNVPCNIPFITTPDGRQIPNPNYPCRAIIPPPPRQLPPPRPTPPQQQFFKRW